MSALPQPRIFSFEEYLLIERHASFKSEYLEGTIYAMAGGSGTHAIIAANILVALRDPLRSRGCMAVGSDLRVAAGDRLFSAYPDVTVFCGRPVYLDDREDVLLNPLLIVEVLSPSTESYDRGEKFERYQRIASLADYLLVSQEEPRVELWHRGEDGCTSEAATGLDARLFLPSLEIDLPLSGVYEGIEIRERP